MSEADQPDPRPITSWQVAQEEAERLLQQIHVNSHYAVLWTNYRAQAEIFEGGDRFSRKWALSRLYEEEDRFPLDLPDWWIVPPPKNWRDNNPNKEARAREIAAERLKAERQEARSKRRRGWF